MKNLKWTKDKNDVLLIGAIVERALRMGLTDDRLATAMDIDAVHANGCPLKLDVLLHTDDANFAHDVCGIAAHLDRKTGKLRNFFLPRFGG